MSTQTINTKIAELKQYPNCPVAQELIKEYQQMLDKRPDPQTLRFKEQKSYLDIDEFLYDIDEVLYIVKYDDNGDVARIENFQHGTFHMITEFPDIVVAAIEARAIDYRFGWA